MATEKKYLDLEGLKIYNEQVKSLIDTKETSGTAATKVKELADGQVKANTNAIATLNGTGAGSVSKAVSDAKADTENKIGTLTNLTTSKKTDLVSAVNEIKSAVGDTKTAGEVTVDTTTTAGMFKSYTLKQNGKNIATIDIPKDMVVSSGEVKTYTAQTLPTGTGAPTSAGTYLVLTLANATNDKVYINVGTLVDIYKAKANATKFQIFIPDVKNNVIYKRYENAGWKDWQELTLIETSGEVYDTGWKSVECGYGISAWSTTDAPKIRRVGKTVELVGIITNSTSFADHDSLFRNIPEDMRPSRNVWSIQQGDIKNKTTARWMMTINPGGTVSFNYYGFSGPLTISKGMCIPVHAIWMVD